MKMLKLALYDFSVAARNLREMNVARDLGLEVTALGSPKNDDQRTESVIDGFPVRLIRLFRRGPLWMVFLTLPFGTLRWIRHIRRVNPDILSAHDIVPLTVGYLAKVLGFKCRRMILVYDSHELETGRESSSRRPKWMVSLVKRLERFMIRRSAVMLVVSDGIRDYTRELYADTGVDPVVVRNIPPFVELDADEVAARRAAFRAEHGIPENALLVSYHGMVTPSRGLDVMIRAVAQAGDAWFMVTGMGEAGLMEDLRRLAGELGLGGRYLLLPPVAPERVVSHIAVADLSIVITPDSCLSFHYCLPNKFFESVQALVPVLGNDLPDLGALIRRYDVGVCERADDVDAIAGAIRRMRDDSARRAELRANLVRAKGELCWERERGRLEAVYRRLIGGSPSSETTTPPESVRP